MTEREIVVSIALGAETRSVGRLWIRVGARGRQSASFEELS